MNKIYITGFAKFVNRKDTLTTFKLSVSRGNRAKDGQRRFLLSVKAFGDVPGLADNSFVAVSGELDSHKYQEKDVFDILCNPIDVIVSAAPSANSFPPGYPLPFNDERTYEPASNVPF